MWVRFSHLALRPLKKSRYLQCIDEMAVEW